MWRKWCELALHQDHYSPRNWAGEQRLAFQTGKSSLLSSFSFEGGGSEGTSVLNLDDENIRIDIRKKDKVGATFEEK